MNFSFFFSLDRKETKDQALPARRPFTALVAKTAELASLSSLRSVRFARTAAVLAAHFSLRVPGSAGYGDSATWLTKTPNSLYLFYKMDLHCGIVELSNRQIVELANCRIVELAHCRIIKLSH